MTQPDPANPLIVHADRTVVLETFHPRSEAARVAIAPFAELERSPEHLHTYRITPLSLWNAASAGHDGPAIVDALRRYSKFPLPPSLEVDVAELTGRWGRLRMTSVDDELRLGVAEGDEPLLVRYRGSLPYLHARPVDGTEDDEELIRIGYIEAIAVLA